MKVLVVSQKRALAQLVESWVSVDYNDVEVLWASTVDDIWTWSRAELLVDLVIVDGLSSAEASTVRERLAAEGDADLAPAVIHHQWIEESGEETRGAIEFSLSRRRTLMGSRESGSP